MVDIPPIIVALDFDSADQARAVIEELKKTDVPFGAKIGMKLACAAGHILIREFALEGVPVFDDQKRVDIPSTLTQTSIIQSDFGALMANCMCHAGPKGIVAFAKSWLEKDRIPLGVTVLTTKDDEECYAEFGRNALEQVMFYAGWAKEYGLPGVVCSPLESDHIKEVHDLLTVCPGIRPKYAEPNDQKRITEPREAKERGVDAQVIGRPITDRQYGLPADNLQRIYDEIC